MTDENKNLSEIKQEEKCFCKSEGVKNFAIVAAGSFVGVFLALSLFTALQRPPMPPMHPMPMQMAPIHRPMPQPMHHHFKGEPRLHELHKFQKHFGPEANRGIEHRDVDRVHPPKPVE